MSDPFDPREVLTAVHHMERDLDAIRERARRVPPLDFAGLRAQIEQMMAADRAQSVTDLAAVMGVVESAWRAQQRDAAALHAQITGVRDDIAAIRRETAALRALLADARLEVRFGPGAPLVNGSPAVTPPVPAGRPEPS